MKTKKQKKVAGVKGGVSAGAYKVDRGVALPAQSSTQARSPISIAMQGLQTGESFSVTDAAGIKRARHIVGDFNRSEKKRGGKRVFAWRRVEEGVRVWRTA